MRILQINSVVNVGSTGRIAEGIGRELLSRGHESYIAYGRRAGRSDSGLLKIGNTLDFCVHGLWSLLCDAHGLASKRATRVFSEKIQQLQPNLIHLHNIHGYFLHYPILFDFLSQLRRPIVWTLHDTWPFTGHCANFDPYSCDRWKTGCFACPMKSHYPRSLVDKSSRNYVLKKTVFSQIQNLTIVAPSNWINSHTASSFLKEHPRITINNGIDLDVFCPKKKKAEAPLVLGVANSWPKSKGLSDFIQLRELLPNSFRIAIVGLTARQAKMLPPGIQVVPKTDSPEELASWYSRATVFANPTYADNFPTTNIEALACGTPVVTYTTGGSPETLSPETGIAIPTGDIRGLANAIEIWAGKAPQVVTDACRARAEERYSAKHRFAENVTLYERLISKA